MAIKKVKEKLKSEESKLNYEKKKLAKQRQNVSLAVDICYCCCTTRMKMTNVHKYLEQSI